MDTKLGHEKNDSLLVPEQAHGRRLDDVLRLLLPQSGRRRMQQLIREGAVRVEGRVRPKGYRVCAGQEVTLHTLGTQAADRQEDILQEVAVVRVGRDFAAVNKPAGMHTQSLWSSPHPGVDHALPRLFPGREAFLLNRLDMYTSGLVLVGLNPRAAEVYSRMQDEGETVKTYLAVVQGRVRTEKVVRAALATAKRRKVRVLREMELDPLRWTVVRPLEYMKNSQSSLVQVEIKKGRRHQIRAHLAAWGHPLVGDELYGQDTQGSFFLHHWKICFSGFEAEVTPCCSKWDSRFVNT
ncbi:MAG: RluA family pseudouridine synthase [Desulfovermiculus sp.]